ncbi:MAG: DUF3786 domain-containing protein [Desulfamplus sp.]|nr:DUF3786 domain-containing protein [Desulfamplus sp.]
MTNLIDKIYFKELAEQDPEDTCKRALCRYDHIKRCYYISVWGDDYAVYPYELKIERLSKNFDNTHEYLYLFIINYLLRAKNIELSNEWISEKDIPGGSTFFRGPHEIPTNLISSKYNGNIYEFKKRCDQLNGIQLEMADSSYVFKITPRIPIALLFWDGDDEFPPESKLLYDKSITQHLALDIIFALSVAICEQFIKAS